MPGDSQYRHVHTHAPDEVTLREADDLDADEGLMEIRLPIASTGEVRNEGDDPLSGAELRGMAQQIDTNRIGVFPEHGMSGMVDGGAGSAYTQFEKLGYWSDADIERDASEDGEDLLVATARMPDPKPLPSQTGDYRQALSIIKEQAKRGIPIAASIGWRDDPDAPGGVDLTEASIVGIGADPRTQTEGGEALMARAIASSTERFDLPAFVETLRNSGMRPLGPPEDPERFDTFEECVDALAEDPDLSREDAEEICGAWEAAKGDRDSEDTHAMTDDTDPDEGTDADGEQHADDGDDTETRADEECPECETAVRDEANYCHECGTDLREDDEDEEADEDDDEEEDEEQAADGTDDDRSADDADESDTSDLEARLADLEAELDAVRSGETDIDTPDGDAAEAESERADDGGADDATDDADEQRDLTDPAEKPAWAE